MTERARFRLRGFGGLLAGAILAAEFVFFGCSGGATGDPATPGADAGLPEPADATSLPTDASADAPESPLARCTGIPLAASGVLDLDVGVVKVTGTLTVNGKPLPADRVTGSLIFTEAHGYGSLVVPLGASTYAVSVTPGTYNVAYEGDGDTCGEPTALPCNGGPLKTGVSLNADGVLDLDIPRVSVTGRATLQALPLPAGGRAGLTFTRVNSTRDSVAAAEVDVDSAHPNYAIRLFPGTYTLGYGGGTCEPSSPYPCNAGPLRTNVEIPVDGNIDVDIPAVTVSGRFTLKGQGLPNAGAAQARFALVSSPKKAETDGSESVVVGIAAATPTYARKLLPGVYAVTYVGPRCAQANPYPCSDGMLKTEVALRSDGVLDLNIPSVNVTGRVTLKGQALPASATLTFVRTDGEATAYAATLAVAAPASTYAVALVPGRYTVGFAGGSCSADGLPCNAGPLKRDAVLTADGALDLDIPVVKVTGIVTLNGQPLPADGEATLTFLPAGAAVGTGGAAMLHVNRASASFVRNLLPGTYTVSYAQAACSATSLYPCTGGPLKATASLAEDGVLDVDIPAVTVTGKVTVNRQSMPDATAARGALGFLTVGGTEAETPRFGAHGGASFRMTLLPSNYIVRFRGNPELCGDSTKPAPVPCNDVVLKGCPQ